MEHCCNMYDDKELFYSLTSQQEGPGWTSISGWYGPGTFCKEFACVGMSRLWVLVSIPTVLKPVARLIGENRSLVTLPLGCINQWIIVPIPNPDEPFSIGYPA